MIIRGNTSLKKYNSFGLDYRVNHMVIVKSVKEAVSLFSGGLHLKKPFLIIGGGTNILFTGNFEGTVILPWLKGIRIEAQASEYVIASAAAGERWDKFVEWSVARGFGGIENLSLIPGNVGAVPVQNIGAYGVEVKDTIEKVKAVSTINGKIYEFSRRDCGFGYRSSIFKKEEKGKFLVTRVYFRLATHGTPFLNYGALKEEVEKLGGPSLKNIREAVIKIRQSKLPDPAVTGNAGSFFKNPVTENSHAEELKSRFPGMPAYPECPGYTKLAAGWMIEQCGWKGYRQGDAGVHEKQALVLVNHGNAGGREIYNLSEMIKISVEKKFGISLEREVEVV